MTSSDSNSNVEMFAYRVKFEDGTAIPENFFSELVQADTIDSWDNISPTAGSTVMNIINSTLKNVEGASVLTGVFVEATNITREIEIIDLMGRIESAEIKYGEEEIDVNEEGTDSDSEKLIFKFKRWRIGVLPKLGIIVIERKNSSYDKKLADFLTSWSMKWANKPTRVFKAIKLEPFLTGESPSGFLGGGSIGTLEFALTSEILSSGDSFFDSDLRDMFKKDPNLVVSIEVKAKRGKSFAPEMTSDFVDFIRKYESNIQKCSGKRVVNNRKSKPINLIDNLEHKIATSKSLDNADVLECVEAYLLELHEDKAD